MGLLAGGPVSEGAATPCFDCGTAVTVLRGDQLKFQATAHYDTGEWRDVTEVRGQETEGAAGEDVGRPIADHP